MFYDVRNAPEKKTPHVECLFGNAATLAARSSSFFFFFFFFFFVLLFSSVCFYRNEPIGRTSRTKYFYDRSSGCWFFFVPQKRCRPDKSIVETRQAPKKTRYKMKKKLGKTIDGHWKCAKRAATDGGSSSLIFVCVCVFFC